jgi:hypothetical protein
MSIVQEYEDWQELIWKIKESFVTVPLEDNILNGVDIVIDKDMLSMTQKVRIRYRLNGLVRTIDIEVDRHYGATHEDPICERIKLVKKHLAEDLTEVLLMEVLAKANPSMI